MDIFDFEKAIKTMLKNEGQPFCAVTFSLTYRMVSDYYKNVFKDSKPVEKLQQKELF